MIKSRKRYNPKFGEYPRGMLSVELIGALQQQHALGKKIFIVVGSSINELVSTREASSPESSGPYIFGFSTSKAEKRTVLPE